MVACYMCSMHHHYYDIIGVDTCVMIIGFSNYNLSSPLPLVWDSPIYNTSRTGRNQRVRDLNRKTIRSLAPARATGPPHHQRSRSLFQWSRERAIPVREPLRTCGSHSVSLLQFWEGKWNENFRTKWEFKNGVIFWSFDLYLHFTHRKCSLKKVSRVDFPSRRFFDLSKVAWVIRMKHRGRSRSLGDSWGKNCCLHFEGSGRCPWF